MQGRFLFWYQILCFFSRMRRLVVIFAQTHTAMLRRAYRYLQHLPMTWENFSTVTSKKFSAKNHIIKAQILNYGDHLFFSITFYLVGLSLLPIMKVLIPSTGPRSKKMFFRPLPPKWIMILAMIKPFELGGLQMVPSNPPYQISRGVHISRHPATKCPFYHVQKPFMGTYINI